MNDNGTFAWAALLRRVAERDVADMVTEAAESRRAMQFLAWLSILAGAAVVAGLVWALVWWGIR